MESGHGDAPGVPTAASLFQAGDTDGRPTFVDRFRQAERFGAYLRVLEPGEVAAGETVEILDRPGHGLTVTELGAAGPRPSPDLVERVLAIPEMPPSWRSWAERAAGRRSGKGGNGR